MMIRCFQHLFGLIENVVHPASGWVQTNVEKRKRKAATISSATSVSPECCNLRGASKTQDYLRRNPAP